MNLKFSYLKLSFIFLIISSNLLQSYTFIFTLSAIDIAKHGYDGIKSIIAFKNSYDEKMWKQKVTESLSEIVNSTRRIEALLTEEADRVIKELSVKFDMTMVHDFAKIVHSINQRYEKSFIRYHFGNDNYQLETIQKFVNDSISESGFRKVLYSLNSYIIPRYYLNHVQDKRLFDVLYDYYEIKASHHRDCNEGSSHHQQLFGVYNLAILTLIRGYTMIIHAYKYRQQQGSDPDAWQPEIRDAVHEFKETLLQIADIARNSMDRTSKEIRRCDPSHYIEDSNYIYLKNFLSIFLTTQTSMSTSFSCSGKCSDYKKLGSIFGTNPKAQRFPQFSCDGMAYDCWKTSITQICLGTPESGRRFEALTENYGLLDFFKHYRRGIWSERCLQKKVSATDFITNDPLCNICACTCDEWRNTGSLRSFSLREQYTDFENGRFVTGVRFKVSNNVIHLEIQEGKLTNGSIDPSTVRWNPEASYLPRLGSEVVQLNYNFRSLNLDDIVVPTGFLVTGVKFALIQNRLSLMVAGLQVYDEFGNFINSKQMNWYSAPNHPLPRTELKLNDATVPTLEKKVNVELSKSGHQFINFQLTDWSKDASQTVVPYIDSQEVFTNPSTPVGGIGVYYKSYEGSGGFITLKLLAASYSIHISENNLNNLFKNN